MAETAIKSAYVFIDASNLWAAQKVKGKMLDFKKLKAFLKQELYPSDLTIFYYDAYPANGTRTYSLDGQHKFFTYLKKGIGFIVRKKPLKRIKITTSTGYAIKEKGNMDIEIAIDVMQHIKKYQKAIFFSGDSDFLPLITYLRKNQKSTYVFSSKNNVARELITGSDGYIDILNINNDIWGKDLHERKL